MERKRRSSDAGDVARALTLAVVGVVARWPLLRRLLGPCSSTFRTTAIRKGRCDCSRSPPPGFNRIGVARASAHIGQEMRSFRALLPPCSSRDCTLAATGKVCQPLRRVSTAFSATSFSPDPGSCSRSRMVTLVRVRLPFGSRRKSHTLACSTRDISSPSLEMRKFIRPGPSPEERTEEQGGV
ncbi:hypothetical protein AOLI_G00053460 [Acnodon oligacanthus]